MATRDNTDQIPIDQIEGTHPLKNWRRKDKMRSIVALNDDLYRIKWEAVPGWKGDPFGDLWFVRRRGDEWHLERQTSLHRTKNNTGILLFANIDPGEEIGYCIVNEPMTVRSAIRRWTRPGEKPPPPEVTEVTQPKMPDIIIHPYGTQSVLSWPAVDLLGIKARFSGDDTVLSWMPLMVDWPTYNRNLGQGDQPYFGNSGIVYHAAGEWRAYPTEWMRPGREDAGTRYPTQDKFDDAGTYAGPDPGFPVAFFVAGMWRKTTDHKRHHRRTNLSWVTWPGLEPYVWDGEPVEPPVEPPEKPPEPIKLSRITMFFSPDELRAVLDND
jgi:hypothetical protein